MVSIFRPIRIHSGFEVQIPLIYRELLRIHQRPVDSVGALFLLVEPSKDPRIDREAIRKI